MTVFVQGQHGVSARVLKDSIASAKSFQPGKRITTFEVTYWRGVLAELNTHGMLCKNSSSSRAIPFDKMAQQLTGRPVRFGQANPGMQDKGEDFDAPVWSSECGGSWSPPEVAWEFARERSVEESENFYRSGYHKQVYNRLTEPFQMMKTVITATEYNNFFWLRDHGAADPSIAELAKVMREARDLSVPEELHPGEWHLPYVETWREDGRLHYFIRPDDDPVKAHDEAITMADMTHLSLEEAIKVSGARTAAVSFRNVDYGVEKSEQVFQRLIGDDRKHGSAMQHQATPMQARTYGDEWEDPDTNIAYQTHTWEPGISHMDREGMLWSAQFQGWRMYRKLIPGENIPG